MLELVNLSNYRMDNENLIHNDARSLARLLHEHGLDGIELMLCQPWDPVMHKAAWVKGIHLRFWPNWLDFWRGDRKAVAAEIGDSTACYGGQKRADWLEVYRQNIRAAAQTPAQYMVYHITNARGSESFDYRFARNSREVVCAAVEVLNELADEIPADRYLLLENLWWPGLTLLDRDLVEYLILHIKHKRIGFMLDTGHLMNMNHSLRTQKEAVEYVLSVVNNLGPYKRYIRGIHLHYSLSGEYVEKNIQRHCRGAVDLSLMDHILKIDQHQPFGDPIVGKLVQSLQPDYLVHEFIQYSRQDWESKLFKQKKALRAGGQGEESMDANNIVAI